MKPNILGGPIGSDADRMLDMYMTSDQREAYERLRKDAERYRWLRKELLWCRGYDGNVRWAIEIQMRDPDDAGTPVPAQLDAAIDAAMNGANV